MPFTISEMCAFAPSALSVTVRYAMNAMNGTASTPQTVISGIPATLMFEGERSRVSRCVNGKKIPARHTTRNAIAKPRNPDRISTAVV